MTPYERVFNRIDGMPVDKIPNLNIVMVLAAKEINVSYSEYATDYQKLVEGNIQCAEKYGIDCVCVVSDPMREASAFGADVIFPIDGVPTCKNHLLSGKPDLSKLIGFDVFTSPRTLDRIMAVELFHKKLRNKYPIIGWVEGVLAESCDLRGINNLMLDLAMDEDYLSELFEIVFQKACEFSKAQIDVGAHIIGIGNAAASLIGPELYEKYALEYDKKLITYIKSLGAKTKLHICGNITPLLPIIKKLEADILDIDSMVDFSLSIETLRGTCTSVNGNLEPVGAFLYGNPVSINKMTKQLVNKCDANSIISAGCEIPRETPPENMLSMNEALYSFKYK
ncbi:MAG: uroporphyrinogen decarboxylase family protein [Clostridiales bacterium]|nr:uroporphyrinogen decarboxylase family protein [Clostridiales bacterium]